MGILFLFLPPLPEHFSSMRNTNADDLSNENSSDGRLTLVTRLKPSQRVDYSWPAC